MGQRPKGSGGEHVSRVICGNLCFKEKVRAKHAGCFYCEHETKFAGLGCKAEGDEVKGKAMT